MMIFVLIYFSVLNHPWHSSRTLKQNLMYFLFAQKWLFYGTLTSELRRFLLYKAHITVSDFPQLSNSVKIFLPKMCYLNFTILHFKADFAAFCIKGLLSNKPMSVFELLFFSCSLLIKVNAQFLINASVKNLRQVLA